MEMLPAMMSTYQSYLFYTRNPAQTQQRTAADPTVARAQQYYQANIGKVKTASDLVNNYQLFSYAMNAYGLQDMTYAKAFMTKVLTSDLSDPQSFVNKLSDSRYKAFAQAFNFNTSGTITSAAAAQTTAQSSDLTSLYATSASGAATAANTEASYMQSAISASTTVGQITGNPRLVKDLLTTYGLNQYTSLDTITQALESDPSDPASFVNQSGQQAGLKKLAADFNVAVDGTVTSQTATQSADMASSYKQVAAANTPVTSLETAYMTTAVASVKSVGDLTGNARLLGDVMSAYGLDPTTDVATITKALESDSSDPKSFINQGGQPAALKAMAADFNFDATGAVATQRVAQTSASFSAMSAAYMAQAGTTTSAQAGTTTSAQAAAKAETTYVQGVISNATSMSYILNDPRVVSYIGKAFGVASLSAATLQSVLTSDVTNLKGAANTLGPNYQRIAAAFEFTTTGTIGREPAGAAQSKTTLAATNSAYLESTVETQAGNSDQGTQLALYFARKAPSLTNAYQILADPALLKVAQTVLGLPASTSTTDIDIQAKQISNGIKFTDLTDPVKLNALVSKFAALYDLANPTSTAVDNITMLFGGTSG
jgi:hypothetical protein